MAQLDRVSDYGSEGWGFKSLWARTFLIISLYVISLFNDYLEIISSYSLQHICGYANIYYEGQIIFIDR